MPGAREPKTVKGAQSDPNYVWRLLLDCVPVFHKIITPAYYFTVPDKSLFIIPRFKGGLGPVQRMFAGGPKNYSYATDRQLL